MNFLLDKFMKRKANKFSILHSFLFILFFLMLPVVASAQEDELPGRKFSVNTNSFWNNWYVKAGAQFGDNDFRKTTQMAIGLGKWFTPGIGTRIVVDGFWGKDGISMSDNLIPNAGSSFTYLTTTGSVLFNLSNMVVGYNPQRLWSFIPFIGGGFSRNCTANEAGLTLTFGLLNEFRLADRWAAHVELGWQRTEPSFPGVSIKSSTWHNHVREFYAEVGVTFRLGKQQGWKRTTDVESIREQYEDELEAVRAQLMDAEAEIERLQQGGEGLDIPDAPEVPDAPEADE